ncbi:ACP S-malonyltransferase [Legionella longbeachae]|uniref:Malonyl CoA-acyl carrier protein transacylase n=1 Tax=Legionella longbeachae serogroup 1 (strain NSW150) TaxID=661367 RepID=D3HRZ4_LEGLN|nr:ACP S-malonyltransferase [Legionella longbeachae]VEE02175.1 malonyl CoA-ACP transacylase [Legionella oakridgensis]HBD7396583.1 ACP S-malonyltransferase [Legionella pneumophila]ARB91523.1 [acyl-carrier-protein] S-malonyltransferase [Legionella longbeachae]EEZ95198.1 malonyl CoA-acyl carrier protein transacylase [Legionella longbeachae D-4968]QIN32056.1 ACP S-malonyltransferase [Legionella longbeachae]
MTIYMFPGQGSQTKGMGIELFSYFSEQIKQADEILGYSVKELCLDDPQQQLNNTEYTQPALYIVEALSFLARVSEEPPPNYLIGHSLGEYAALFAAGAFDFGTGLKLVKKRGELMAKATGGGMLAVINLAEDRIKSLLQTHDLDSIDFANFNSPKQIVLSGPAADIAKANEILAQEALMCLPLKVSGAFHSRYMQSAADEFKRFMDSFQFSPLKIEVIANITAEPYINERVKENLVKQMTHPVRWTDTIRYLKNQGECVFIEVGPGNVLTRLNAQI